MPSPSRGLSGLFIILLVISSAARAQGIARRSGEVGGTIGYNNLKSIDNGRYATFGVSGAYNLSPWFALGGDYTFQRLGTIAVASTTGSEHLQLIGPVARFSANNASRLVPYVVVSGGGAVLQAAVALLNNSVMSASQKGFYFGVGGGASIYGGHNWGVRPEFRYERLHFNSTTIQGSSVGSFGQNDYQGTVTVFYQFGGRGSIRN